MIEILSPERLMTSFKGYSATRHLATDVMVNMFDIYCFPQLVIICACVSCVRSEPSFKAQKYSR